MTEAQRLARRVLMSAPASPVTEDALRRYFEAIAKASRPEVGFDVLDAMARLTSIAVAELATCRATSRAVALGAIFAKQDEIHDRSANDGDMDAGV
jgi:hypothetical protein